MLGSKCHICSDGNGNTTCFACLLGVTGSYGSERFLRLMIKGIIDGSKVTTLSGSTSTEGLILTKWQERQLNKIARGEHQLKGGKES